ncbi:MULTISPECIES: hypothetical protein [Crocosphaera]|uniref:Uncharacterized protein n=5 Tax=Crocosphaera watsonii TaxID=263511 RepID=T2JPW9_CROWT|nr:MULTISPECIES: hypothetical protein [Crocosphaera]EHJ14159.1 hypothetical protein CWATWH0003_1166 [Crocosphaera watsonii WH 0003]MCH2246279.1 hypothetical protein [Crocosphaera sp.]NQZ62040.1 hypothetical protein [Crocosphaera sp.]CCQ49999.1 hypothetical protein CWATWH8502_3536 [Crocosphaera watsonii WH 8502]CCQ55979.1 hypothetical protein CWATWH0005_5314 [Crocosphaera watsonii WH 0005]
MNDLIAYVANNPSIQDFFTNVVTGEITIITGIFWLFFAGFISMIAGAIGGILLAGKDLGYELAAILGGLFGPAGVLPVAAIGLVVLKFV